ncbi:MAG: restriction endonuclease subunit S [Candidatus Scalindua sp.]|nr:restriction endonuclease subunit S [Candidatus Scalindua sp.]
MKYRPYPKYKPSGIDWIGDIPEGWEVRRLKFVAHMVYGNSLSAEDRIEENIPVYGSNGQVGWHNVAISKAPCIIVGRKGSYGKVNFCDTKCFPIDTTYFIDERFATVNLKWLFYILQLLELDKFSQDTGVPGLSREYAYNKSLCLPPHIVQQQIADFLDQKTAQIDELIGKKEEMINLLKEKRAAVINQAVTCGLDEKGSLRQKPENLPASGWKPSGIDWIGDIPEGWEIFKLKYLTCKIGSGITPKGGATIYQSEGIPLLRSQNIHFDSLHLDDVVYISEEIHSSMIVSEVQEGDVLFNITGASIGRCNYWEGKRGRANVNQHVCIVRPSKKILTKFLWFFLSSDYCQQQMLITQEGSSREGLNFKDFGCFTVILSSKDLQIKIVDFLDKKTAEIDGLIHKIKDAIDKLREYRSALITDAVTGKIDVREVLT